MRTVLTLILLLPLSVSAFEPFFDEDPSTKHAPVDPGLTDLDLDVLILCGGWGDPVIATDFERMMLSDSNRDSLLRIFDALAGRVYRKTTNLEDFVQQLRQAWFQQKGFQHVFCGEPGIGKDLGGLHYAARYWQAEDEGWAGYRKLRANHKARPLEKCRIHYLKEKISHPIYTISIAFLNPENPLNSVKCLGGYHY
ncbi:MAG: EndoU domain-containing protein, partial [Pseudomonadota bacterium]